VAFKTTLSIFTFLERLSPRIFSNGVRRYRDYLRSANEFSSKAGLSSMTGLSGKRRVDRLEPEAGGIIHAQP
jgi:hypothetical protein